MKREWIVRDTDDYGDIDRQAAINALLELEAVLYRMGGAVTILALREETDEGYIPAGLAIQWDSYSPARRVPVEAAQELPEPAEDDAEADALAEVPQAA